MAKEKPVKLEIYRDKYFSTVVWLYRGCKYEVQYANSWNCCVTPAWVQHRDAQADIDDMLDNPHPVKEKEEHKTAEQYLDELWEIMGW